MCSDGELAAGHCLKVHWPRITMTLCDWLWNIAIYIQARTYGQGHVGIVKKTYLKVTCPPNHYIIVPLSMNTVENRTLKLVIIKKLIFFYYVLSSLWRRQRFSLSALEVLKWRRDWCTVCIMYTLFSKKNQAENIGTSLIPMFTVTTEIWAVVCDSGGHNLVRIEIRLNIYILDFRHQMAAWQPAGAHIFRFLTRIV
jgi:hypothetical protein